MAQKETSTIREVNFDNKDSPRDIKIKEIEAYWDDGCKQHHSNNH